MVTRRTIDRGWTIRAKSRPSGRQSRSHARAGRDVTGQPRGGAVDAGHAALTAIDGCVPGHALAIGPQATRAGARPTQAAFGAGTFGTRPAATRTERATVVRRGRIARLAGASQDAAHRERILILHTDPARAAASRAGSRVADAASRNAAGAPDAGRGRATTAGPGRAVAGIGGGRRASGTGNTSHATRPRGGGHAGLPGATTSGARSCVTHAGTSHATGAGPAGGIGPTLASPGHGAHVRARWIAGDTGRPAAAAGHQAAHVACGTRAATLGATLRVASAANATHARATAVLT
jgi:hypothetical protein